MKDAGRAMAVTLGWRTRQSWRPNGDAVRTKREWKPQPQGGDGLPLRRLLLMLWIVGETCNDKIPHGWCWRISFRSARYGRSGTPRLPGSL